MTYAVNMRTKEHREWSDALAHTDDWIARRATPDGWIDWWGDGECPLPDGSIVDIRYRYPEGKELHRVWPAESTDWREAVAYRPILDAKPEAPMPEQGTDATTPRRPFLYSGRLRERLGPFEVSPPAWDGEGLPPVGCECEYRKNPDEWLRGMVFGHRQNRNGTTEVFVDFGNNWDYSSDMWRFRPIRSEEDRAVGEMASVMYKCDTAGNISAMEAAKALYLAGYRRTATSDGEDV